MEVRPENGGEARKWRWGQKMEVCLGGAGLKVEVGLVSGDGIDKWREGR